MDRVDWLRSYGLIIDYPIDDAHWHRVPTEDHPKKRNGAYMVDGDLVVCQNWATMPEAVSMPRDGKRREMTGDEIAAMRARAQARDRERAQHRRVAAQKATAMLAEARPGTHGYLMRKGFHDLQGLVLPDAALFIPMRSIDNSALVGAQLIRWDQEERVWDKKYLFGQASAGAAHRLGNDAARETILCEGYATGLSIRAALEKMRIQSNVLVAFSAHNMVELAKRRPGLRSMVFADNDEASQTGQKAAQETGLPWVMADTPGWDANDLHVKAGLLALCAKVMELRRM